MIAPISCIHKLTDAALNVGFLEPAFIDGKHHIANHVVSVVPREVSWDDGVDASEQASVGEVKRAAND